MVTVGGSGVGGHLLRRVIAAFPHAEERLPDLRMIVWPDVTDLEQAMYGGESSNARRIGMYTRVVRFTDVSAERMQQLLARVKEADGPPPGVPSTGLKILFDEAQGTAVVLQQFDTMEDLEAGAKVFAAMDPSETPGTRTSVDACELKLELKA